MIVNIIKNVPHVARQLFFECNDVEFRNPPAPLPNEPILDTPPLELLTMWDERTQRRINQFLFIGDTVHLYSNEGNLVERICIN